MFRIGLSVFVVCFFLLGASACWHGGHSGHSYGGARHYNGNNQKYYRSPAARPDPEPGPQWHRPVKPRFQPSRW